MPGRRRPLEFTIRPSYPDDASAIYHLAALDEAKVPPEPLLLASVDDELWAAVSLETLEVIADPFRPSGELASIVVQRACQLQQLPSETQARVHGWGLLGAAARIIRSLGSA